ncbi:MAG: arylamine N-acetyltransferase [Campylobacteraceae bacterium]|nr:arylamine N-acetyltransferase [Campylobacteraceae bacterium]
MKISKILERINLDSSKTYEPTLQTLQLLQKQYMLNVPYENLDFVLNRGFSADLLKIYEKIVLNNRGGICYESHTLFIYLLKTLGFRVQMIFAKVEDLTYIGKDYPHLIILVNLHDIDYLVDVANGQSVREPMNIDDENFISIAENNEYKIKATRNEYILLVSHKQKDWVPRYYFTKEPKRVSDFADIFEGNDYHKFANKAPLLVTLAKKNGRVTMQDDTITVKEGNNRRSWNISKENKAEILRDYFNINIKI